MKQKLAGFGLLAAAGLGLAVAANAEIEGDAEKIGGWVFQYEHDSSGAAVEGDLDRLIDAIQSGADVKYSTTDKANYYMCQQVGVFTESGDSHVYCDSRGVALVNGGAIRNPPYHAYTQVRTTGDFHLARASIYGGGSQGETTTTSGIRWYARVR